MGRGKYRKRAETISGSARSDTRSDVHGGAHRSKHGGEHGGAHGSTRKVSAVNPERLTAQQRRRRKLMLTWSIVGAALVLFAVILLSLLPKPSPYTAFAKCVTANGAVLYGTDWCSHCQAQKRMFGDAFTYVAFENCDYSSACAEQNITGYPTWIFADGERLEGTQALQRLAEKTGCALP